MNLREEFIYLPSDWRLVRVGPDKRPIGANWQSIPGLSPDDAIELETMPPAFGLLSGPQSGCIVLDLDGEGWREDFQKRTGHAIEDLPETIAWTSGKPGRSGRAFQIDPDWWPHLANRKPFESEAGETLWELRGDRHQAVIIGVHPETGSYNWLPGCSPQEIPEPAAAPDWLLELLTVQEIPQAKPVAPQDDDADRAIAMLAVIPAAEHSSYDGWLRIGMALHSVDPGLLSNWIDWSSGMTGFDEAECLYKWQSFGKSNRGRPATIASLHFLAKQYGYKEPAKRKRKSKAVVKRDAEPDLKNSGAGDTSPPQPPQHPNSGDAKPKRPFGLLGFAGDNFYYQPDESGQVTIIARPKHSATNMLGLARLDYWSKEFPRFNKNGDFTGIDWQCAFDTLFAEQYKVGFFDPDNVRGLGAWWDDGRVVLHLGDRLIVDGTIHYLTRPFESKYCYQRLRRLEGPGKAIPLTDDEAMQVLEIAATFMWEDKSSAFLLAGWLTLAPICGALSWRPHVWLTAASGTGKSTILERFVGILLGDMFVQPEGKSTEPSIRQELMSSALAVVLDEAEQNKEGDKLRIQSILDFARSCSSEGKGQIMKGSSDQSGAKKFRAKAMFLMSSVATALKEGADKSRFAQLTLRKNEKQTEAERTRHWIQLDGVLRELITEDFALRLIARTINLIPMIRDASRIFATAAAEHLGTQRLGDQYGALAAGAWSLCHQQAPTLDEAREWIAANPLTAHAEASEVADEKSCLQTILEHQIRVDVDGGAKNRTVLALVKIVRNRTIAGEEGIDEKKAERALGRLGIRVDGGRLEISNTAKGLRRLLKETAWESCWPTVLSRMEGATKPGAVWFPEIGTSRATSLPMPDLE
jgi:putative DNA primase/helicase